MAIEEVWRRAAVAIGAAHASVVLDRRQPCALRPRRSSAADAGSWRAVVSPPANDEFSMIADRVRATNGPGYSVHPLVRIETTSISRLLSRAHVFADPPWEPGRDQEHIPWKIRADLRAVVIRSALGAIQYAAWQFRFSRFYVSNRLVESSPANHHRYRPA